MFLGFFNLGLVELEKGGFGPGRGRVSLRRKGGRGSAKRERRQQNDSMGVKSKKGRAKSRFFADCGPGTRWEDFRQKQGCPQKNPELENIRDLRNPHFPSPKRISKNGNAKREVDLQRKKTNHFD